MNSFEPLTKKPRPKSGAFGRGNSHSGKGTMQVTKSVFALIPLQDFSADSDIDWTANSNSINEQLFAKYSITEEEQQLIDTLFTQKTKKQKK